MTVEEWENGMLSLPIAGQVSGEHEEHQRSDVGFVPYPPPTFELTGKCRCDRCKIIRIKRRRAIRFPRTKCSNCGNLFVALFVDEFNPLCKECQ